MLQRLEQGMNEGLFLSGIRNKLLNGDFDFWQRGASFTITPGTGRYGPDRWYIANDTNQTLTITNSLAELDGKADQPRIRLSFTVAPTTGTVGLYQQIEGCSILSGQNATFTARISVDDAIAGTFNMGQNFGSGGSAQVAQVPQAIALSGSKQYGKIFSLPSTSLKVIGTNSFTFANLVLSPRFTSPISVWHCSVNQGDVLAEAEPFEKMPSPLELLACQRYYEKSFDLAQAPTAGASLNRQVIHNLSASVQDTTAYMIFKAVKRVTPTMVAYNAAGATGTAIFDNVGQMGGAMFISSMASLSRSWHHWTADAEL